MLTEDAVLTDEPSDGSSATDRSDDDNDDDGDDGHGDGDDAVPLRPGLRPGLRRRISSGGYAAGGGSDDLSDADYAPP